MDRKERFVKAYNWLKYEGVIKTQEDVAQRMGSTRPNVSLALNGRETALTDQFIARFCAAFTQISYTWLLFGRGEMLSDQGRTIIERIREVLKIERTTAASIGLDELQEHIDNDTEPDMRLIDDFCKKLDLNRDWVVRGVGNAKNEVEDKHAISMLLVAQKGENGGQNGCCMKPRIPVNVSSGGISVYLHDKKSECDMIPAIRSFPSYDFTMFIKDNSMEPRYERGDEIALKEVSSIIEWGKEYVLDTDDGAIFKRIYPDGKDSVKCVSYNSDYPDFTVKKSAIHGFFKLVGMIRV